MLPAFQHVRQTQLLNYSLMKKSSSNYINENWNFADKVIHRTLTVSLIRLRKLTWFEWITVHYSSSGR